ncbi:MAG: hypothetical protein ACRD6W_03150, partial [Nitrososphaerales archaeon]
LTTDRMKEYPSDGQHLRDAFGISGVLNTEIEQSDASKGFANLCECGITDNSHKYPAHLIREGVAWAQKSLPLGPIYIHCHAGGGRSAAFAYAVLRGAKNLSCEDALIAIRNGKDWKYLYEGRICLGSITEYPRLNWGDEGLASHDTIEIVERALSSTISEKTQRKGP